MLDGQGFDGLVGRSFNGFRLTRLIARGGMGVVYEGVQESLDRPIAVKFLYPHLSDDDRFRDRFEREARAAARLNHPNIVRILDFGVDNGLYYMVQDLIVGDSLRDRLTVLHSDGGTLRTDAVMKIVEQVGHALSYAHDHGYVHRDVKPGNILMNKDGQAFLTDFGVVKIAGANSLTAAGMIIGTPEYMAPEQSAGATDIGPAADQYSLAVVTYEMLVGRVPFQAPTPAAVMRMHLTDPPPPPSTVVPWFPQEVEKVLGRALAKEPFDRYASVDEFIQNLKDAIDQAHHMAGGTISRPPVQTAPPVTEVVTPVEPTGPQQVVDSAATPSGASGSEPPSDGGSLVGSANGGAAQPIGKRPPVALMAGVAGIVAIGLALGGFFFFRDHGSGGNANTPVPGIVSGSATSTSDVAVVSSAESTPAPTVEPSASAASAVVTPTAEPTPAETPAPQIAVATPPPNSVLGILFSSHRGGVHSSEIYIMNADGSGQRQLTSARGHSWGPRITPDGTGFFFSSVAPGEHTIHDASGGSLEGSGNHDIYIANFSGDSIDSMQAVNINNITAGYTSWDNGWTWSPDGQWIVFSSDRAGNWELYKMTLDGRTITRLTENPAQDGWPWWTPDGQHILFSSNRDGQWQIYEMDPDGSNVKQLTNIPDRVNLFPAVSPDGTKVVFSSQDSAVNEGEIYIMNIDGSDIQRLTNTVALNNIPSFCPDGQHIVFESDRDGNANIFMMNVDGSDVTRLTNDPGEDTTPSCGYMRNFSP